jgi:hypothetical protein
MINCKTYISIQYCALFEAIRLIVVVDTELLKQDLVLVC